MSYCAFSPNTHVHVTMPDLTAPNGATVRPARIQFLHNDPFEHAYSWRTSPPVYRYCVVYDDEKREVQQWVDARCLSTR